MVVPLIIAVAGLILSGFSFLFCFAYLKRRTGREGILVELGDEINEYVRDVNEITNRDTLLVEDRVKTLKALLEDADRRIALLSREITRRQTQEDVYVELGKLRSPIAAPPASGNADAVPAAENAEAKAAQAVPPENHAEAAPSASPKRAAPPGGTYSPRVRSVVPRPPSFSEQVAELYRAGISPDLIAVRLGAAVSEVELAVALVEGCGP
jgi:hypothetical protein